MKNKSETVKQNLESASAAAEQASAAFQDALDAEQALSAYRGYRESLERRIIDASAAAYARLLELGRRCGEEQAAITFVCRQRHQNHTEHLTAWQREVDRLTEHHKRGREAVTKRIDELEKQLDEERKQAFLGNNSRLGEVKAALTAQRGVLEDLGVLDPPGLPRAAQQHAGVPGLVNERRLPVEGYREMLENVTAALEAAKSGDAIPQKLAEAQEMLDRADDMIGSQGRKLVTSTVCGR